MLYNSQKCFIAPPVMPDRAPGPGPAHPAGGCCRPQNSGYDSGAGASWRNPKPQRRETRILS